MLSVGSPLFLDAPTESATHYDGPIIMTYLSIWLSSTARHMLSLQGLVQLPISRIFTLIPAFIQGEASGPREKMESFTETGVCEQSLIFILSP
jgi:hypothetical protein